MSNTVDERIVEAKFDANDFEKGVNKTLKKLDELKKSLNLKETGKSVTEFTKEASEGIEKSNKALDRLSERLTTFKGMIKQKILGGLADEISSVFLGLEQSITGFVKSLSSDQMRAGMDKYTEILNSVRTMTAAGIEESTAYEQIKRLAEYSDQTSYSLNQMTSGMSKLVAAGMKVDKAEKSMEGLANMCASAGVNIYDAQRAFLNFAQAYSSGTMKLNDWMSFESLNMATENVMKVFMEAGEQVGTLTKTIKKDGTEVYKTVNKVNKQVKAGKEVATKGFRDTLNYGWLDKKTMEQATAVLSYFEDIGVEVDKLSDDQLKTFAARAFQAAKEARSFADVMGTIKDVVATGWATSFELIFGKLEEATKFFTWLSESNLAQAIYKIGEFRNTVLKTWGEAYAGEDEEGNLVGGVFVKGKTGRDMLMEALKNIDELIGHVSDGLEGMAKYEYNGVIKHLLNFPETLGKNLGYLTKGFRDATRGMLEFFTTTETVTYGNQTETRRKLKDEFLEPIQKISDAIGASFSIISKLGTKAAATFGTVMEKLTPVFLAIGNAVGTMLSPIVDLDQNGGFFDSIQNIIDNVLTIAQPVLNVLPDIIKFLGEVGTFFTGMAIDTITMNAQFLADSLGLVMEIFGVDSAQKLKDGEGVLGGIRQEFEGIKEACESGINAVKDFMSSLIGDLRELFGLTEPVEGEEGGVFSRLTKFFETNEFLTNAKAWIDQAIVNVTSWIKDIPNKIKNLGASIYDTLYNLFFTEVTIGSAANKETVLTPLGEWLNQAIIDIKAWFADLPNKIITGVGAVTNWINEVLDAWFGKKNTKEVSKSKHIQDEYNPIAEDGALTSKFDDILLSVKNSIVEWFTDLPNKINTAFSEVGNFAANLWDVLDDFLFGKKTSEAAGGSKNIQDERGAVAKEIVYREKGVLQNIIDNIVTGVTTFIRNIPEHIKSAIKGTGDIITTILNTLLGKKPDDKEPAAETVGSKLQEAFKNFSLSGVLDTIKDIGKTILNQIIRIFTGSEDFEVNTEWLSGKVNEGFAALKEKADEAWENVKDFFVSIPSLIAGIFNGEGEQSKGSSEQNPIKAALLGFGSTIGGYITDIPQTIMGFLNSAIDEIDKAWTNFYNGIKTDTKEDAEKVTEEVQSSVNSKAGEFVKKHQKSKWELFIDSLGQTIKNAIDKLPTIVAQAVDLALKALNEKMKELIDWISIQNPEEEISKATDEAKAEAVAGAEAVAEAGVSEIGVKSGVAAKGAEKKAESPFKSALNSIGATLRDLIIRTIPELLKEGWSWAVSKASALGETLTHLFDDYKDSDFQQTVNDLGEKIKTKLLELPGKIAGAFKFIAKLVKSLFSNEDAIGVEEGMSEVEKNAIEAVEEKKEEIAEELGKEGESGNFFEQLGQSMLDAFKQIGPIVLNGLSTAFDWLSTIGTEIAKIISGEKSIADLMSDEFKKENPELIESMSRIGESFRKFFAETLPDVIGSAIGVLINEAPKFFTRLFEGINKSYKEAQEKEEQSEGLTAESTTDAAKQILNFVQEFISKLAIGSAVDIAGTIAVIAMIIVLLNTIKDMFSITDDVSEASAKVLKWSAIVMAVSAISGIFGFIEGLVAEGNEEKLQNAKDLLDKLKGFLDDVLWIVGILAGKDIIGTIGDVIKAFKGEDDDNGGADSLIGKLGEKLGGDLTDILISFIGGLKDAGLIAIVGGTASTTIDALSNSINEAFMSLSDTVSSMIDLIAPYVEKLFNLHDKLSTAIEAAQMLGTLFTEFHKSIHDLYENASGNDPDPTNKWYFGKTADEALAQGAMNFYGASGKYSTDAYIKDLNSTVDYYLALGVILDKLGSAMQKLESVKDIGGTMDKLLEVFGGDGKENKFKTFVTSLFNTLAEGYSKSYFEPTKFADLFDPDTYAAVSWGLQVLETSLSAFGEGIMGLDENNVDALQKVLDMFNSLVTTLKGDGRIIESGSNVLDTIFGDTSLSRFGSEIKKFGLQIKPFINDSLKNLEGFDEKSIDETKRKMNGIVELASGFADVCIKLGAVQGKGVENLGTLGDSVGKIGGGLSTFINYIVGQMDNESISAESLDKVRLATEIVSNIVSAAKALNTGEFSDEQLIKTSYTFAEALKKIFEDIESLAKTEDNPIKKAFDTITGAVFGDLIIRPEIRPVVVIDKDVYDKAKELEALGFGIGAHDVIFNVKDLTNNANSANPNNFIMPDLYSDILGVISGKLDGINSSLGAIPGTIGVGDVMLNEGALVGHIIPLIDRELGRLGYLSNRGGRP